MQHAVAPRGAEATSGLLYVAAVLSRVAMLLVLASCSKDARVADDAAIAGSDSRRLDAQASDDAAIVDAPPSSDAMSDATVTMTDAAPDASASMIVLVTCPAQPAASVTTSGFAFSPQQTSINVGSVVRFEPASLHDVTSGTPAEPQSWFTAAGGVATCYRFDVTGTFPFFCSIHPSMTGSITVM